MIRLFVFGAANNTSSKIFLAPCSHSHLKSSSIANMIIDHLAFLHRFSLQAIVVGIMRGIMIYHPCGTMKVPQNNKQIHPSCQRLQGDVNLLANCAEGSSTSTTTTPAPCTLAMLMLYSGVSSKIAWLCTAALLSLLFVRFHFYSRSTCSSIPTPLHPPQMQKLQLQSTF